MSKFEERQMCTRPVCCSCENCLEILAFDSMHDEDTVYHFCMLDIDPNIAVSIKCEAMLKGFFPEKDDEKYSCKLTDIMGIKPVDRFYRSYRRVDPYESCNFYKEGDIEDRVYWEEQEEEDGEI